jgi:hypothetical protein
VALVILKETEAFHHPRIETVARMARDLAHDVKPIFEPLEFASSRRREDCRFAILALIAVLGYDFAIESETRLSVV